MSICEALLSFKQNPPSHVQEPLARNSTFLLSVLVRVVDHLLNPCLKRGLTMKGTMAELAMLEMSMELKIQPVWSFSHTHYKGKGPHTWCSPQHWQSSCSWWRSSRRGTHTYTLSPVWSEKEVILSCFPLPQEINFNKEVNSHEILFLTRCLKFFPKAVYHQGNP